MHEATVEIAGKNIRVAVVNGLGTRNLLEDTFGEAQRIYRSHGMPRRLHHRRPADVDAKTQMDINVKAARGCNIRRQINDIQEIPQKPSCPKDIRRILRKTLRTLVPQAAPHPLQEKGKLLRPIQDIKGIVLLCMAQSNCPFLFKALPRSGI